MLVSLSESLSLNLPAPNTPLSEAKPAPATFTAALPAEPKPVVLPASMEAAIR